MSNQDKKLKKKMPTVSELPSEFEQININAAGIDIGAQRHYVAVPKGRDVVVTFVASISMDIFL